MVKAIFRKWFLNAFHQLVEAFVFKNQGGRQIPALFSFNHGNLGVQTAVWEQLLPQKSNYVQVNQRESKRLLIWQHEH